MYRILDSSIRRNASSENKITIAARMILTLAFLVSSVVRHASANVIHVTSLDDKVSSTGGCSLKEAIYSSTLHDTLDGAHGIAIASTDPDSFITTGCEIGTGNDTIILPTGYTLVLATDTTWDAHNPYGPTAMPIINSNITIQGNGATLQWAGAGHARLFAVGPATITTPSGVSSGTGNLTLINVQVYGFQAKGGDGTDGGGGGLGAGGAIYVQNGSLTIQDSTFDSNVATGGSGGSGSVFVGPEGGGGGGGLGGNGGHSPIDVAGGGGGGARGNGGDAPGGGGGGGGTVNNGATSDINDNPGGPGGYLCGGDGGNQSGRDGDNGTCPGGGGGGAGYDESGGNFVQNSHGGNGAYGGGGGGGTAEGGNGGFGGGGGAISNDVGQGGNGGFGGGGGLGQCCAVLTLFGNPGQGGAFGGNGDALGGGGGGAALGGVIFSDTGTVLIENSTFANNFVVDGQGGFNLATKADNGGAAGAIFTRDGSLTIIDSTISGNQADGSGAGVVVYSDGSANFTLDDTILAHNGANECYITGSGTVTVGGAGNLIMSNGAGGSFNACPGVVATADPQLGPLQLNSPGLTATMAISPTSSAFNAADPSTSLGNDQRGVDRPEDGGFDIGSYEYCPPPRVFGGISCPNTSVVGPGQFQTLTMGTSPLGVGGSTSPAVGVTEEPTGSVVVVSATPPNLQYYFVGWAGDVTEPLNPVTTIIMSQPLILFATFAPCNCVVDTSFYFAVTRGPILFNPVTRRYAQAVTLTNTSAFTIFGPISLVLEGLSSNATLSNASGATLVFDFGSPYVTSSGNLAPGKSVSFTLQFTDPTNAAITYGTGVLSGPGLR